MPLRHGSRSRSLIRMLLSVFVGLLAASPSLAQGNSAPDAVDDVIVNDRASYPVAAGSDFEVNTITSGAQRNADIADLAGDGFVVVWEDASESGDDLSGDAIRAQRFDASGAPAGAEFLVNTTTVNDQRDPAVAGLANGTFVVAWTDESGTTGDTSGQAVRAQLFAAEGTKIGTEFLVNSTTTSDQAGPSVAALPGGGFVIAWMDGINSNTATDSTVILGQRFDADGDPEGSEFAVSPATGGSYKFPGVAAFSDGRFVIAWVKGGFDTSTWNGTAVHARLFAVDGSASGDEIAVDASMSARDPSVSVAVLGGGDAVVTWNVGDGQATGSVRGRRFGSDGAPMGAEFMVNNEPGNPSGVELYPSPSAAPISNGGFAVAWAEDTVVCGDICARYFDSETAAVADNFQVNTSTENLQRGSVVETASNGGLVVAWTDFSDAGSDTSVSAIRARLFQLPNLIASSPYTLDVLANDTDPDGDTLTLTHVAGTAIADGGMVTLASGATVTLSGGELVYDPRQAAFAIALPKDETADDTFTYTISDGALSDTANVTVTVTGVNDAPTAVDDTFTFPADTLLPTIEQQWRTNDSDPDTGETAQLTIASLDDTGTLGQVELDPAQPLGDIWYVPAGAFDYLAVGETSTDQFSYTAVDPHGATSTATVTVVLEGVNEGPTADADALVFSEEEGARDVTAALLEGDSDPDNGETAQLAVSAIDTNNTVGQVTLASGTVTYNPNGMFNDLEPGETATDRFRYTISDPQGATATAEATVTINGFAGYQLSLTRTGLGAGTITSAPSGLNCGGGGACATYFTQNEEVALSRFVAPDSRFASWGGDCAGEGQGACVLTMDQDRQASARFELVDPPDGRIVAATLPGARSGYVGGTDITVFMTVLSRATTPAQSCRITAPGDPPFTLSYREVNAENETIGDVDPLFDLGNGGAMNFVIALTPTRTTGLSGYVFLPRIACENADLDPIEGVNSVLVSIGNAPVPDILSIGATPSGDGVVRIPETGNRISFMTVAAVNIGAGDGSAGAGEATVTANVDTGAASLPLTLEVCETISSGACITPRGSDTVTTVFEANVAKYFAVFVRANGEATVPFDPANARVFLRFTDSTPTIRSATSAAVSAPAPAGDRHAPAAAVPAGRWSVLVRQRSDAWPSLARASLFVLADGTAILENGSDITRLHFDGFAVGGDIGRFEAPNGAGSWTQDGRLGAGSVPFDLPGDLWGVRDARGDVGPGWDALAGLYGDAVRIASDGTISGAFAGCMVSGRARPNAVTANGLRAASVHLMGCASSGEYIAVIDTPANDSEPALLLSGTGQGWRIVRNR